jgi:hypothetical protein
VCGREKKWKRWEIPVVFMLTGKRPSIRITTPKSAWKRRIGESEKCPPVSPE